MGQGHNGWTRSGAGRVAVIALAAQWGGRMDTIWYHRTSARAVLKCDRPPVAPVDRNCIRIDDSELLFLVGQHTYMYIKPSTAERTVQQIGSHRADNQTRKSKRKGIKHERDYALPRSDSCKLADGILLCHALIASSFHIQIWMIWDNPGLSG